MNNITHPTVSIEQVFQLAVVAHQAQLNLCLLGRSGIGKTECAREMAARLGAEFDPAIHVLNFSGSSPAEAVGYGVPGPWREGDMVTDIDMRFSVPQGLPTRDKYGDRFVLVVFDEFSNWDASIQSLALGALTPVGFPKKWGPHELAPNLFIVITGNRRKDGSRQSSVLSAPNVARCLTAVVEPDLPETLVHFAEKGLAESAHWGLLSFMAMGMKDGGSGSDEANAFFAPDPVTPWDGMPYPCPRQHERSCMATMPDAPMMDGSFDHQQRQTALAGMLGADAGARAAAWITSIQESVGTAKKVLAGTESLPSTKSDAYAVMMAAYRIVKKGMADYTSDQRAAAVAGGEADAFVNNVMIPASGELRKWVFEMAIRPASGGDGAAPLPLDIHTKADAMQNG